MKKLVALVSIITMAVVSQGAQFNWGLTASKAAATPFDGATVYMILAADYDSGKTYSLNDITSAAKSTGTLTVGSMTATTGNVNVSDSWVVEGQTYEWYAVVVSGDQYYVSSGTKSSTAVSATATPAKVTFGSSSEMASASNWKALATVPEPTSAMLMMLGIAGLALKRKRA